jgi:hypothetical protein
MTTNTIRSAEGLLPLLATFTTTVRSEIERDRPNPGLAARRAEFAAGQAPLDAALRALPGRGAAGHLREREARPGPADVWTVLPATDLGRWRDHALQPDGSYLASGTNPATMPSPFTRHHQRCMRHHRHPARGPRRQVTRQERPGTCQQRQFRTHRLPPRRPAHRHDSWSAGRLSDAHADFEQIGLPAAPRSAAMGIPAGRSIRSLATTMRSCFTCAQPIALTGTGCACASPCASTTTRATASDIRASR